MTTARAQTTDFTLDVTGRYVCNGLDEAKESMDPRIHPDARPFDYIVVGGGTFGSIFASHLFNRDVTRSHRILLLEAGPMLFTEHVQNQPLLGTSEVFGTPWDSASPFPPDRGFPGLAFCVGGRSLFWGGWSPYFLPSEVPSPPWPASVVRDLLEPVLTVFGKPASYLDEAALKIGSATNNDFLFGPLHDALSAQLFAGLRARPADPSTRLVGHRGSEMTAKKSEEELRAELEAPLAVETKPPRPGMFPWNKFSSIQLLIRIARIAQTESEDSVPGDLQAKSVSAVFVAEQIGGAVDRQLSTAEAIDLKSRCADGFSITLAAVRG